jgi:WXG100 family type VII secretion target
MAGGFQTGIPTMQTAGKHVEQVNGLVRDRLKTLRDQVESTMSGWKGSGSTSWRALMTRYDTDAQQLNTVLHTISTRMGTSQVAYQASEEKVRTGTGKIASSLKSVG